MVKRHIKPKCGRAGCPALPRRMFSLFRLRGDSAMKIAGALHPPCRRKKLRPLRPRLAARTSFCSVPSSSPHKILDFAGPPFFLAKKKERMRRARWKREKDEGERYGGAARRGLCNTKVSSPRRGAGWGFGGYRMDQRLFSLPLVWCWAVGPDALEPIPK